MSLEINIGSVPELTQPNVYFECIINQAESNSVLSNFAQEYIKNK